MELTIERALQQGVAAHKQGKLQEAERLYRTILKSHPEHPDANHNLGLLAVSVNKVDAALPLFKTALEANPKVGQFWLSYIDALIKEQQLNTAKLVFEQAKKHGVDGERLILLEAQLSSKSPKPNTTSESPSEELLNSLVSDYQNGRYIDAENLAVQITQDYPKHQFAWKVLGAVLRVTNRNSDAVKANQTAVALSPQDAAAHSNLGNTLRELGRLNEALASYNQSIALRPNYALAHYNLGATLQELGRLDEAEASYLQAIVLDRNEPRYVGAYANLITYLDEAFSAHFKLENLWKESRVETNSVIMLPLAIHRFLMGDLKGCRQLFFSHYSGLSEPQKLELNHGNNYWGWLRFLLDWHAENPQNENIQLPLKTLYVIGDSHSLAYNGINLKIGNDTLSCKSEWIWGCKQFHIGNQKENKFKYKLEKLFSSLPPASSVLLCIGEIDCRLDDGIIPHCKKNPEKKIQRVISATTEYYLDYILEKASRYLHKVTIQGIPCPNVDRATFEKQEIDELIELIQKFNIELEAKAISYGLEFLDLSAITDDSSGFSNKLWHADAYHITPDGALEALRNYKFK